MDMIRLDAGCGALAFSTLRGNRDGDDVYAAFNVCHYTGDDAEHVARCRGELAAVAGVDADRLVIPRQTHSVNVAVVGDVMPDVENVDALVTRRSDVALVVNTADCLPIVFNDGADGVVGVAHGGWRGLYGGIIEATLEAMKGCGAETTRVRAAIGPCICGGCYEVDDEFAEMFAAVFGEEVRIVPREGGKPHVDLREVALRQFERCGIGRERVFVSELCSRCDERLFSARRLGVRSGRIATVVKRVLT